MTEEQQSLKDLSEIRSIMERSTQFLSLSGLSGVFAGIYALIAAWFVYYDFALIVKTMFFLYTLSHHPEDFLIFAYDSLQC